MTARSSAQLLMLAAGIDQISQGWLACIRQEGPMHFGTDAECCSCRRGPAQKKLKTSLPRRSRNLYCWGLLRRLSLNSSASCASQTKDCSQIGENDMEAWHAVVHTVTPSPAIDGASQIGSGLMRRRRMIKAGSIFPHPRHAATAHGVTCILFSIPYGVAQDSASVLR